MSATRVVTNDGWYEVSSDCSSCNSSFFHSHGLPCRHILFLANSQGLKMLPSKVFHTRWLRGIQDVICSYFFKYPHQTLNSFMFQCRFHQRWPKLAAWWFQSVQSPLNTSRRKEQKRKCGVNHSPFLNRYRKLYKSFQNQCLKEIWICLNLF